MKKKNMNVVGFWVVVVITVLVTAEAAVLEAPIWYAALTGLVVMIVLGSYSPEVYALDGGFSWIYILLILLGAFLMVLPNTNQYWYGPLSVGGVIYLLTPKYTMGT